MISVITPVYNGEEFIESCIKVVIEQDYPDIEHIIVDGGSTDKTVEIIQQYAKKYPHIRWISEKDRGQSDAMNKGIIMANKEIIAILNVDDYYEPNVLRKVSGIFKKLPEPSLLVGNCNVWNDKDKLKEVNKPAKLSLINMLSIYRINEDFKIDFAYPVNPSAYFYHKSLHQKIGLYKVEEHYAMDLDFLFKAVQAATVKYVNETWGNFRYIQGTKTFQDMATGQSKDRRESLISNYVQSLSLLQKMQLFLRRLVLALEIRVVYFTKYPQHLPQSIKKKLGSIFSKNFWLS